MSIIASRQSKTLRWQKGDLIGASEASALLGYKSAKQFQDAERLKFLVKEFESVGCALTTTIWIGGQRRFLRREIDDYLTKLVERAQVSKGA